MEILMFVVAPFAIAIGFGLVIRWALRWKDPSTSSPDKQAEARLWSKKNVGR